MKNIYFSAFVSLTSIAQIFAQEIQSNNHSITISTYVDSYFAGYNTTIDEDEFEPFITVGARNKSFGLNVAQLGVAYEDKDIRGNLILHYGDIPQATWSEKFNIIQEANVGVRIVNGLWLDAGFFATHIGAESFLPKNNFLSSTAFLTYNEPFYQAGAKLSYDEVKNWNFELWALNGYNSFVDTNRAKSFGVLASYNLSEKTTITYTNLYGRESVDGAVFKQNRFYQNIYLNKNWNDIYFLIVGFDFGFQSNSDLEIETKTATMYGGMILGRFQINRKLSVSGRAEIFNDENGFISGTYLNTQKNIEGLQLTGFTLGTEFKPVQNAYLRAEGRYSKAPNNLEIFKNNENLTNERFELLFTIGLEIEKTFSF